MPAIASVDDRPARFLWTILIFSIFVVIVREIVVVFVPLRLDRLPFKCRRTGQDLADVFLFSPNIHDLGPFCPSSARHPWRYRIYFYLPGF
jgi:hypothetical protein